MTTINAHLTQIERCFNMADSLPLVGTIPAVVRVGFGHFQFNAGCFVGVVGLVGQMAHPTSEKWENITSAGGEHMIHGALNVLRGWGEAIASITVFGSAIPLGFQIISSNGFDPQFKYSGVCEYSN